VLAAAVVPSFSGKLESWGMENGLAACLQKSRSRGTLV